MTLRFILKSGHFWVLNSHKNHPVEVLLSPSLRQLNNLKTQNNFPSSCMPPNGCTKWFPGQTCQLIKTFYWGLLIFLLRNYKTCQSVKGVIHASIPTGQDFELSTLPSKQQLRPATASNHGWQTSTFYKKIRSHWSCENHGLISSYYFPIFKYVGVFLLLLWFLPQFLFLLKLVYHTYFRGTGGKMIRGKLFLNGSHCSCLISQIEHTLGINCCFMSFIQK